MTYKEAKEKGMNEKEAHMEACKEYNKNNSKKISERKKKKYLETYQENKDRLNAKARLRYKLNTNGARDRFAKYRSENRDKTKEYNAMYRKANPEKIKRLKKELAGVKEDREILKKALTIFSEKK